ncbi:MAG: NCS2 family permease [Pirellulales bacterium]|nr:NCS2 family permease [Pirellulales bacterium]
MLDRVFKLSENKTDARTELLAGLTTFLTMAYIIVLQPMVLTGQLTSDLPKGMELMDFKAVMAATCIAAALATAIMGLYGRYPIAQAPGMGENFFFIACLLPAAHAMLSKQIDAGLIEPGSTTAWQVGLGVIFYSGLLFLLLSLLGVREKLLDAISPSMRNGIAIGIGLFIVLIGMKSASLLLPDKNNGGWTLNARFNSPDLIVFFFGLLITAALHARRVRGSIILGIAAAALFSLAVKHGLPLLGENVMNSTLVKDSMLMNDFVIAEGVVSAPPSIEPTLLKMDLVHSLAWTMVPFILIFLFMDLFDTLGTLIGVAEQADLVRGNRLPRAKQALLSDAVGTVAGAALGTSTVTSFIESAAGVEQGGRTGLTALAVAALFILALFFGPIVGMVGSYRPITAPALVVVGTMMMRNVVKIDWGNYAECLPALLIIAGIPLTFSIADGLALGFIAYPLVKLLSGQGRDVKWLMYAMTVVLVAYFVAIHV